MSGTSKDSTFQRVMEDPKGIIAYRIVTGVGTVFITGMVSILVTYAVDINKSVTELRISAATALGRTDLLNNRVDVHAGRLNRMDDRQDKLEDRVTKIQIERKIP